MTIPVPTVHRLACALPCTPAAAPKRPGTPARPVAQSTTPPVPKRRTMDSGHRRAHAPTRSTWRT
ncbi:hypothetical protein C2E23DRAFT_798918 [Lenzites betulinus]|nr:hypothetical protein C2E23DRAFT_798918 [Lenzites betulinus]